MINQSYISLLPKMSFTHENETDVIIYAVQIVVQSGTSCIYRSVPKYCWRVTSIYANR